MSGYVFLKHNRIFLPCTFANYTRKTKTITPSRPPYITLTSNTLSRDGRDLNHHVNNTFQGNHHDFNQSSAKIRLLF